MTVGIAVLAREFRPFRKRVPTGVGDRNEGQDVKNDPERLCPQLKPADQSDAVGDQRNDDERAVQVADRPRYYIAHLQGRCVNYILVLKEDEGNAGVTHRSECRVVDTVTCTER